VDFWKGRKVLVTGGCGFLGSYLVEELVAADADVTVVDNLESGTLENLSPVKDQIQFIWGDLRDRDVCKQVSVGFDLVMNLAGRAYGLEYSMKHHGEMLYHNTVIQLHMLEAAHLNGVKRFLVVSSSCIYPDDAPIPTPELDAMTRLPEQVNEGYGWAKRIAELQAKYYHDEYGMGIAICRPFNPYGGRYRWSGEKSHVIPTLVKKVLDGQNPVVVWGSGRQRRNFLHARDNARLMMMVTERYPCAEPVNIGYDDDISIAELVSLICEASGKHPEVVFDTSMPEGRFRKCPSATLLRRVTDNYRPKVSLRQGIEEMIGWYYETFGK
jgi:nucleoside-diphosphate-sugar epimerase